jgi:hypothetical protein
MFHCLSIKNLQYIFVDDFFYFFFNWEGGQGSRKLELLEPPVPDKSHLVGQNEI